MSKIAQIPPDDIKMKLQKRLVSSWALWNTKITDDLEQEKVLFFKYYFDFSTAIEHCIRGIMFEHSSHEEIGSIITNYVKPDSDSQPFLVSKENMCCIISESNYNIVWKWVKRTEFQDLIDLLPNSKVDYFSNYQGYDFDLFLNDYNAIRKTRNILAHGIEAMDNGTFTSEFLMKYLVSFIVIYSFYKHLYKRNHGS